jgi:FAD synthetase
MTSGKRVLAAGKFDILHLGHLGYLEQCKELAGEHGELVVIIALDSTIKKERGAPPVFPQQQRRRIVESLAVVDRAILGYDTDDYSLIVKDTNPDIIALGYDPQMDIEKMEKRLLELGMSTRIVRLEKRNADGLGSSTLIRRRIIEYYKDDGTAKE